MKRQTKLILDILQYVEEHHVDDSISVPEFDDWSKTEVNYHVDLCVQAGYLDTPDPIYRSGIPVYQRISRLTWAGHEELDRLLKEGCEKK